MAIALNKPLTFDERKDIEKLLKQGLSCSETARRIQRSKNAVTTELKRAGGHPYSAKKGQEIAIFNHKERIRKATMQAKINNNNGPVNKRLLNLEMQIEILHETIKELINERKNKKI